MLHRPTRNAGPEMPVERRWRRRLSILACCVAATVVASGASPGSLAEPPAVSGLPQSRGKSFPTLDAYLAHLEKGGAMDLPWYRLEPDGRYRLIAGPASALAPEYFTRAQLMRKFGFSR